MSDVRLLEKSEPEAHSPGVSVQSIPALKGQDIAAPFVVISFRVAPGAASMPGVFTETCQK